MYSLKYFTIIIFAIELVSSAKENRELLPSCHVINCQVLTSDSSCVPQAGSDLEKRWGPVRISGNSLKYVTSAQLLPSKEGLDAVALSGNQIGWTCPKDPTASLVCSKGELTKCPVDVHEPAPGGVAPNVVSN